MVMAASMMLDVIIEVGHVCRISIKPIRLISQMEAGKMKGNAALDIERTKGQSPQYPCKKKCSDRTKELFLFVAF